MTEKIATIERNIRQKNANVTDSNIDMFFQDALDELDTEEFVDQDEIMMGNINEDNYDDNDAKLIGFLCQPIALLIAANFCIHKWFCKNVKI